MAYMTFNSLGLFFFFFYGPDGDRGCVWTESRAELAEAFTAEGKHVTSGVWSQWESHGEPLIAFITFSQIKMSTSGKNSVPLCSLVIRGSISPPFHTRRVLWKRKEGQRQKELQLVCLGLYFSFIFLLVLSLHKYFLLSPNSFISLFFCIFFNYMKIYTSNSQLQKSTKRHNIVWKFQILLVSFYIFKSVYCWIFA